MDLNSFQNQAEAIIYKDLHEFYKTFQLNQDEIDIFKKYENICKYWALRAKRTMALELNGKRNFIKRLAILLINLQHEQVNGPRDSFVKEMFGDKKIHRCYETKNGFRQTINSNKLFNSFFELEIMSHFLKHGFKIQISQSKESGHKIPEFIAIKRGLRINIEAKKLDTDKILDNLHGDCFTDGFDFKMSSKRRIKGFDAIKSRVADNYDKGIGKFVQIPDDEYFVLFLSIYELGVVGNPTVEYLSGLPQTWIDPNFSNFAGVVIPQYNHTVILQNENCNINLLEVGADIGEFHAFSPEIIN